MNSKLSEILAASGAHTDQLPTFDQWKQFLKRLDQHFTEVELLEGVMEHSYGTTATKKDYLYLELEDESLNIISKQRDRLEQILEILPCWVSVINKNLEYVSVNQYVANLYGVGRDGFVGKYILWQVGSQELIEFVRSFIASNKLKAQIEIEISFVDHDKKFQFSIKRITGEDSFILVGQEV